MGYHFIKEEDEILDTAETGVDPGVIGHPDARNSSSPLTDGPP